jgi:hypothetical protein
MRQINPPLSVANLAATQTLREIQGMRPEWLRIPAAMRVFSLSRNFLLHNIHEGTIKAKRYIVPGQKKVTYFVKVDSLLEFMARLPDAEAK